MFVIKDLCLSISSMFQVNLHNLRRRASVSDRFQTDPTEFNNTGMLTSLFTNIPSLFTNIHCTCVFTFAYSHQYECVFIFKTVYM